MRRLFNRLKSIDTRHRRIAFGMIQVAVFLAFGRGIGAVKEMAFAWRFGVGPAIDAYAFLFAAVSYPLGLLLIVYTTAFIPLARKYSTAEKSSFKSELFGISLLAALPVAFIAFFALNRLLHWSLIGLSVETVEFGSAVIWIIVLLVIPGVMNALFSSWILDRGRHGNTLLESIPSLCILITVFLFPADSIMPLAIATLIGFTLQSLLLGGLVWRSGDALSITLSFRSALWAPFLRTAIIVLASQGLLTIVQVTDPIFAAASGGTGSVATLSYANRFLALLIGVGGTAINRAAISVFSDVQANDPLRLQQIVRRWLVVLFLGGVATGALGWIVAPSLIRFFFERGAFTAEDTAIVSELFRTGLPQLPFHFAALLIYTELASRGAYRPIIIATAFAVGAKLALNALLLPSMGLHGIPAASVVMQILLLLGLVLGRGAFRSRAI
jgi:peptidoglycan biosynthesis protein MviN/MurJ (putative lipid II flippase)